MSDKMKLVIIGGVAGGASAAARARRLNEDAEIILIERGEFVSFANCGLPYHISGAIADRERLLVQTPDTLYANLRIDVRINTEAIQINRSSKQVIVKNKLTGEEQGLSYDKLILSPGAEPIIPTLPGVDNPRIHTLRSMSDMDKIIRLIKDNKPTNSLIIGGGYIGLEMAEALRELGIDVVLVELAPQVMASLDPEMAAPIHQQLKLNGVDLRLETSVTSFTEQDEYVGVNLSTGEKLDVGLVIMAIGVRPETKLAIGAGLALGERGGILVDDHMLTSDPDIYAVGDAVEVKDFVSGFAALVPLAGPANKQGRIAADNAMGRDSVYKKTQGTGICKIFDLTTGMTGNNEKTLKRINRNYEKIYIHPTCHASYYPGASQISLKVLFDPDDGKILGAQGVGLDGVDKRIDVMAAAIRAGLTVFDLEEMELSYAPPYGSAKDPVNYAGYAASNFIRGDVDICHTNDMLSPSDNQILLDVRTAEENMLGTIPGSINIPLQQLRDRIGELPSDKELLVFCQVGLRGYLACRILKQKGFKCRNLTGGYKTYTMATDALPQPPETITETTDANISMPASKETEPANIVKAIDACGLQCPGPILRVANEIKLIKDGEAIEISSSDSGFAQDISSWCNSTGNRLISLDTQNGIYKAVVQKGAAPAKQLDSADSKKKSIVVFSGDLDKAIASFIIANGAAAMGSEVTMFFTFWGINILRKPEPVKVKKNIIESIFGWMMPRGADDLELSNMNMLGIGSLIIKGIMKKKNVPSLPELIKTAQRSGVHLVVCSMSMDLMGIKKEELIDGVDLGGVAMYLDKAESGNVNLFI